MSENEKVSDANVDGAALNIDSLNEGQPAHHDSIAEYRSSNASYDGNAASFGNGASIRHDEVDHAGAAEGEMLYHPNICDPLGKLSLTVAIIAHNEQDRLPSTLAMIEDIASEIIVINSVSTDATIDVAREYGAKVFTEEFKGFVDQKNSLIPKCTKDWILFLDADEVINDELKGAIIKAITENSQSAYEINRFTYFLGKRMMHTWQPNYRLRLVRRDADPKWCGVLVHESLQVKAGTTIEKMPGYIMHYSFRDIADFFSRQLRYAKMSAKSYVIKGKKPSLVKMLLNPFSSFVKQYFIKRGFLDGTAGFVAAIGNVFYTFLKYAFLWENSLKLPEDAQSRNHQDAINEHKKRRNLD